MVRQKKARRKRSTFRLYTTVRTPIPFDFEQLAKRVDDSSKDTIPIQVPGPLPLERVTRRLSDIATDVGRTRADRKIGTSVRELANECAVSATQVRQLLEQLQSAETYDAQFVAHAMEHFGELEAAWHRMNVTLVFEDIVEKQLNSDKARQANIRAANKERSASATRGDEAAFRVWEKRLAHELKGFDIAERVRRYIKLSSPKVPKRRAARLRAMVRKNQLK